MSEDIDLDLFIGSKSSYERLKREKNIKVDEPDEESSRDKPIRPNNSKRLSKDNLEQIDEETMTILKRTRCVHDYTEVFMQSSLEFYDQYYNDTDISPELKAARKIRRMYKRYDDFLEAMKVRKDYMSYLIDKYGGNEETFYNKMSMGLVPEWIPPTPTLSKKSEDYELYTMGMIPFETETLTEEETEELFKTLQEECEDELLEKDFGVETSIGIINAYNDYVDSEYSKFGISRGGYNSTTVSDLEELNKVFRSWYKKDDGKNGEVVYFKNAPENIKKRFYSYCPYNEPGLLAKIARGEEMEEPEQNLNEMVHDKGTGRSMTRKELNEREFIRTMAKNGWSESRLMNYMNVGSKLERMKRKKPKKKKKRSMTIDEEMFDSMNSPYGMDGMYSDNDLSDLFTSLMRD